MVSLSKLPPPSKHTVEDMPKLLKMFSEKKSYTIHAHNMFNKNQLCPMTAVGRIHVHKIKTSQDKKDQYITYEVLDLYDEDGELVKSELITEEIKEMRLFEAVSYVQNIEMFQMWLNFNNAKRRGTPDEVNQLAKSIIQILIDRNVETIGSGKFEEFDHIKLKEILDFIKVTDQAIYDYYMNFVVCDWEYV